MFWAAAVADRCIRARPVSLVSENLAREFWGTPSAAIGKRFRQYPKTPWQEVIGVVQDVRENGVQADAPPTVYWPTMMSNIFGPGPLNIWRDEAFRSVPIEQAQRFQADPGIWVINSNLPLASVETMQEIYDQSLAQTSFTLVMLGIAGTMALTLGIIGIYGVISYAVSQRTREIGIRLALGAQAGALRRMFVRHAVTLAAIGTIIGLTAAAGLMRLMKSLLCLKSIPGPHHLRCGAGYSSSGRGAGQLFACPESGEGRSGGGSEGGVIGRRKGSRMTDEEITRRAIKQIEAKFSALVAKLPVLHSNTARLLRRP